MYDPPISDNNVNNVRKPLSREGFFLGRIREHVTSAAQKTLPLTPLLNTDRIPSWLFVGQVLFKRYNCSV